MENLQEMSRELLSRLDQLSNRKVVIFGDIGLDEYVQGDVSRISPEAPVPVVDVSQTSEKLGLSANVAANINALGGDARLFSLVGQDQTADTLRSLLQNRGISTDYLMTDPNRKTTTKLRVMTGHHHIVRVDYENKQPIDEKLLKSFQEKLESTIEDSDLVILQDYAKGQVTENSSQQVIALAKKHGKRVLVDPYRSTPLKFYQGAQLMTPNRDEAMELAKQIPQSEIWQDVDAIGKALMEKIDSPQMVITLGPEGMKIFDQQDTYQLPTFAKKVFDVTGAGDTVIAAFSMGMAAGWDIKNSGFLANMAAGVVVAQVGAVACRLEDLKESLSKLSS